MPGFHHSVAVLPLPFRRSNFYRYKIPLFCKKYVRKFRSVTAVYAPGTQRCTETTNGNGEMATVERERIGGNRA